MERDARFLNLLLVLAVMEASTLIVLVGIGMPLKYFGSFGYAVKIIGPIHGVVWLLYMWVVLATVSLKMWKTSDVARLVVSSVLPFGGFVTAKWIEKQARAKPVGTRSSLA